MEEIDRQQIRVTFLFMWRMLDRYGFIKEARDSATSFQVSYQQPTIVTFICWGLASRFWRPDADLISVWEEEALPYLETQILFEKEQQKKE